MNQAEIQRIRDLLAGVTPGPWLVERDFLDIGDCFGELRANVLGGDADYLAALSPDVVGRLLDAAEAGLCPCCNGALVRCKLGCS